MQASTCGGAFAHVRTYVWKPEVKLKRHSLEAVYFSGFQFVYLGTGSPTGTWGSLIGLGDKPQGPSLLHLPITAMTRTHHTWLSTWVLEITLRSSCFLLS